MIGLWPLAVTLLSCFGASVLGQWALPPSGRRPCDRMFSMAVGLGLLSLAIFALGLASAWQVWVFRALVGMAALAGLVLAVWNIWNMRFLRIPSYSRLEWLALCVTASLLGLALLGACAPVTDWDGLSYHLAVPELYLRQGGLYFIPFIHHSNFPLATEMLYAPAVALESPEAAKVVHWVFFVTMTCAAGSLAQELFGGKARVWAALAATAMPVAIWEAQAAYIDLSTACFVLLSATALVRYLNDDDRGYLVLAALMAGMGAGTKTFALGWLFLCVMLVLLLAPAPRSKVKDCATCFSIAVTVSCPWFIKSLILTGNPVYPFLYSIFGGRAWGPAGAEMYRQSWTAFGVGRSPGDLLMLPWDLMARGGAFIDGGILFGSPGPLLVALLPAAALKWKGSARALAAAVFVYVLVWFGLSQQTRYLLPVLALSSVLVVASTVGADLVGKAARCAVLAAGAVSAILAAVLVSPTIELISGHTTRSEYVSRHVNSYWAAAYLPRDDRLLLYREPRGFYFPQTYMWADEALSSAIPYNEFQTPAEMLAWLRRRNWQTALINRRFVDERRPGRDIELWDEAIRDGLVRPYAGDLLANPMARDVELWEIP